MTRIEVLKEINSAKSQIYERVNDNSDRQVNQHSANETNISDNSDGLFDLSDMADENSSAIYDLADLIEELDARITALEEK